MLVLLIRSQPIIQSFKYKYVRKPRVKITNVKRNCLSVSTSTSFGHLIKKSKLSRIEVSMGFKKGFNIIVIY